ncbi:MAG: EAL domain-containing protein, partial [Spirochaetaceae bacterium]|nr:EAL domain-containing protein [Spirochaetaceae bacterium]
MVDYKLKRDNQIEWQKEITLAMDNALITHEFIVYYQPKSLFSTSECIGAEALIRWSHKEKGLLPPSTFLPLFEKNGFIQKLDVFVFENVCRFLAKWMGEGHKPVVISCNLSRLHLQNPRLTSILTEIAEKYGVSTEFIEIELTESLMHHDIHNLIETMLSLKKAGFKISIDDFGSGYSSLNMLKDIPADVLKIDKEFLSRSTENPKGAIILSSIVTMAKQLNLRTIAEGVEIIEEVTMLKRIGCEMVQGYYYAKPMPVNDFNDLLLSKL